MILDVDGFLDDGKADEGMETLYDDDNTSKKTKVLSPCKGLIIF
jgi:hypothetical protein